jgi:hypothetical protein
MLNNLGSGLKPKDFFLAVLGPRIYPFLIYID